VFAAYFTDGSYSCVLTVHLASLEVPQRVDCTFRDAVVE